MRDTGSLNKIILENKMATLNFSKAIELLSKEWGEDENWNPQDE